MANSSDWIAALLERPEVEAETSQPADAPKPLSWLPDFGAGQGGFVEGTPFARLATEPVEVPDELRDGEPQDELEDILLRALAKGETPDKSGNTVSSAPEAAPCVPTTEPALRPAPPPAPRPDPEPDPIAEAYARGEAAGRQAAQVEHKALSEQKIAIRHSLRALDQAAMDALANDLAQTVIALCSASLADFVPEPATLANRCHKAAQRLGSGAGVHMGEARLYLHPDDLALIDTASLEGWHIVGDPTAERGGLRIETKDGSVSDRPADWRRAIATAIKG